MRPLLLALLLALMLGGASAASAWADDQPAGDTPAEKAFRDAWWAETAGGELTKAIDLYGRSLAAEGPAGVKARALYRQALVLQRVGRTEQALAALERLTKEYAGETALLADARARLTEWTAVDLRTGFPEWYRRFQYGPEFQAKVVDLVLKLGVSDDNAVASARRELLTIGEPAVAALRAHLGSHNDALAREAVSVLLSLGIVPDEVTEHQGGWSTNQAAWKTILALPTERRAALRARLGEEGRASVLFAALGTPDELWAWAASPSSRAWNVTRDRLLGAFLDRLARDDALAASVRAASLDPTQDEGLRKTTTWWLRRQGLVQADDVRRWADTGLVLEALQVTTERGIWTPDEALAGIQRMTKGSTDNYLRRTGLEKTLVLLPQVTWPDARDRVAEIVAATWQAGLQGGIRPTPSPQLLEAVEIALDRAREQPMIDMLWGWWDTAAGPSPEGHATRRRWAATAATPALRERAMRVWFQRLEPGDVDAAVEFLADASASDADVEKRWYEFFNHCPRASEALTPASRLQRLLDRVPQAQGSNPAQGMVGVLVRHKDEQAVTDGLLQALLAAPERFPGPALLQNEFVFVRGLEKRGLLPGWRKAWWERWSQWDTKQRGHALWCLGLLKPREDADTQAALRARLAVRPGEIPPEWRNYAIQQLKELTLDDLRAFYDLTKPADVDEAFAWTYPTNPQFPRVEATAEAFEALKLALRPDSQAVWNLSMVDPFSQIESVHLPLARLLLAHQDGNLRHKAMNILLQRSDPTDADLWAQALKDPNVSVRVVAAKGIERVPTPVTLKALVLALDDPHPDVRAAALASLDAIQKMEDLKARWKERVK